MSVDMNMKVLLDELQVTESDVRRICQLPQRSEEWMKAREGRITGSRIGSIIGLNPYQSVDQALCDLLWGSDFKGNAATRRGTELEPRAAESLLRVIRRDQDVKAEMAVPGLIVCLKDPIFAYSPDGVILFSDGRKVLVEIKVPFNRKPYDLMPKQYYCQMQLGMYVMDLSSCLFTQYCGEGKGAHEDCKTVIEEVKRNDQFIESRMLPLARKFYNERYLPMRSQQLNFPQKVRKGQIFPACTSRREQRNIEEIASCQPEISTCTGWEGFPFDL